MKKLLNIRLNLFHELLILQIVFFFIPIVILISQSLTKLDNIKNLSNETSKTIVKEQTAQICKLEAQNIAKRISDFLISCESDIELLSQLPVNSESFLKFSNSKRYVNSLKTYKSLYKEIAFINSNGVDVIKISDNVIVPKEQLKNVSIPANTTFKSETYFEDTKNSKSDIYMSHLNGWYISRQEQKEKGKSYSGIFRLCKKKIDDHGNFSGIYMLALDHIHIMDFVWQKPIDADSLISIYKTGNYNYIIDDEGWIIVHPKLWDIKGFDKNGNLIEPLTNDTPGWKVDAGLIPMNFMTMDWRLRDINTDEPISSIVKRVRRGETAVYTMRSSGIYGDTEGIIRTRACAPIFFNRGEYEKFGIFGGVVVGTSMDNLLDKTNRFTAQVEDISEDTKIQLMLIALVISLAVLSFSFFLAKFISRTISKLNNSLIKIGHGEFIKPDIASPIKEINEVNEGVIQLSNELKEKDEKISRYIKDLEIINIKLGEAKKELDSYWKHEYETESDVVLEEKIKYYEKQYPKLKEIRKNIFLGKSQKFLRVLRQIVPLSQMNIPTWIYGESGVGKTILAYAIHLLSPRCEKPYQAFAASEFAAADPVIVLGKLFGYGSGHGLRGINQNGQKGIIEECHGGTLLIDDVDALPVGTQAQLLRVVDGLAFHPAVGKSRKITSDVRFIFTTNVDLEQLVNEKLFRKDLFRRMGGNINKIEIPPLRDLRSDIPLLAKYFINRYCERYKVNLLIKEETLNLLASHDFPEGNIGELKMLIELACENTRIENETYISMERFHKIAVKEKQKSGDIITGFSSSVFNEKECKELEVLRRNYFHMEVSEEELGYKRGSRILSHHLRGICLRTLCGTEWNIEEASKLITGSDSFKINETIIQRIKGYIKNISEKGKTNQKESLFSHLPKEYHSFLIKAISRYN